MAGQRGVVIGLLVGLAVVAAACGRQGVEAGHEPPAVLEPGDDDPAVIRIRLTERAAERLGVESAPVRQIGSATWSVPYGAIFYGTHGETWVYVNPEPLVFVRHQVIVDRIEEGLAILTEAPPVGTLVATSAVAELYGTETGMGGTGH